ncbi:MFS transporter [Nakamurella endophytica]|uniref:MFS transporter n=1 Tax=Nakamurella endophytica TaxID=1748367 RepID=A0A917SV63_9ACTN|nr:MFS transporter [Nakamurella endophytica]GGL97927.1 MFS transporter [Nakamurella endophytica]
MAFRHALIDLTPLRISPAFRRLWLGRSASGFGSQMTQVAVLLQIWQQTRSTVWTGLAGLAQAVPILVLGLVAGTIVDRTDRRRFYLVTTTGQALCSAALAAQALAGGWRPPAVLAVVALQSCFVAGGGPASRTFLPRLLPADKVPAGQALQHLSFQAAMLGGPALGGVIAGGFGLAACYLVDAVSFGLAFLGARGLPAMRPTGEPARAGLRGVGDGLRFLAGHRTVRGALLTDLASTVLAMPISLFPAVNAERFGDDPRTLGLFLSSIAVGGVLAGVFSGHFTRARRQQRVMFAAAALWGLALAAFGVVDQAWLGLGCLVVAGAADTVAVVARGALVQLHTPDELRGRVASAEQMVGQAGPDVGDMRAGLVARWTSPGTALLTGGLACVAVVAALALTAHTGGRAMPPGGASTADAAAEDPDSHRATAG